MRMKKRILFIALLILFSSHNVLASEADSIDTKAGFTPNSRLYPVDLFFEKLSLKLSFSDEKKVKKLLKHAEERLAELNEMDPDQSLEEIDILYDAYGYKLARANTLTEKLMIQTKKGKNDQDVGKLKDKLENATNKEALLNKSIKDVLNEEVLDKVQEVKTTSYLTSMIDSIDQETIESLREQEFGYGVIVKLSAFSQLSGMSIDELLELDIYSEDDPNTEEVEKELDFKKIETTLAIDKKDLIEHIKDYRSTIKAINENKDKNKDNQGNPNPGPDLEERLEKIRDSIKEKVNNKGGNKDNNGKSNKN
jgi:hypothetical protein